MQDTPPMIIDVEASGFGPDSYPIEVGLALENGEKFCSLIRPAADWRHWDESAEKVHRVTRDILEEYGRPLLEVAGDLNSLLQSKTVYSDGWVVDKPWIDKLFYACHQSAEFTVSSLEMVLTEKQMEIWHETKDRLVASEEKRRHRASFDASIIQTTWSLTRSEAAR